MTIPIANIKPWSPLIAVPSDLLTALGLKYLYTPAFNHYAASGHWIQNDEVNLKNDQNPGTWVLLRVLSVTFQWIPTWKGLDDFQKSVCPTLEESSLSIGRDYNSSIYIEVNESFRRPRYLHITIISMFLQINKMCGTFKWCPSIHMEVKNVRIICWNWHF